MAASYRMSLSALDRTTTRVTPQSWSKQLRLDDKEHLGRPKLDPAGAFDPSLTLKVRDVPQR